MIKIIKKAIVAETHLCSQLSELLGAQDNIDLVICSHSYEQIMRLMDTICFDIAFIRINKPELNGLSIARELRQKDSNCQIVFMADKDSYAMTAFEEKADGFLLLPSNGEMLSELSVQIKNQINKY